MIEKFSQGGGREKTKWLVYISSKLCLISFNIQKTDFRITQNDVSNKIVSRTRAATGVRDKGRKMAIQEEEEGNARRCFQGYCYNNNLQYRIHVISSLLGIILGEKLN